MRAWQFILITLAGVAACTSQPLSTEKLDTPSLVWPDGSDKARIKFLYSFKNAEELGFSPSFFQRIKRFFQGKKHNEMVKPYAIAVHDKLIAVADPGMGAVHLYDRNSKKYRRIRKAGKSKLVSPVGICIGENRIYVTDSVLGKVFLYDLKGRYVSSLQGMQRPSGIAYDRGHQRLYVADTLRHQILIFNSRAEQLSKFGTRGDSLGTFNFPTHIYQLGNNLYINDTMNFRVQIFDLEGHFKKAFGKHGNASGNFAQPKGIGVDSDGNIYVADARFNRIQIFNSKGNFLLAFGGQGETAGQFWLPAGLTVVNNQIFVADSYNRRIQVFQFLGSG